MNHRKVIPLDQYSMSDFFPPEDVSLIVYEHHKLLNNPDHRFFIRARPNQKMGHRALRRLLRVQFDGISQTFSNRLPFGNKLEALMEVAISDNPQIQNEIYWAAHRFLQPYYYKEEKYTDTTGWYPKESTKQVRVEI